MKRFLGVLIASFFLASASYAADALKETKEEKKADAKGEKGVAGEKGAKGAAGEKGAAEKTKDEKKAEK